MPAVVASNAISGKYQDSFRTLARYIGVFGNAENVDP